jgi:hypothetical protein
MTDQDQAKVDLGRLQPFVLTIATACYEASEIHDPYIIGALMLRESGAGQGSGYRPKGAINGWGDDPDGDGPLRPFAYGLFQIDRRYHADFISSPEAETVEGQAKYALALIEENRHLLRVICKVPDMLEHGAIAAYNCGPRNVIRALSKGLDVDTYTTGRDYSAWIWKRADGLRQSAPFLFNVLSKLQG